MASRFQTPFPQFLDSTPAVRAGAKLFFYAAGTSTKQNTYSDRTLSTPNSNPVVLNSAGYPSVDIFLQDLDYKVVLAPSTDTDPPASPIWSADYVRGRDSALVAKTVTGSGSPNGSVAGTAGSSSILPDFYWDYTNLILYVCTTTGTSSTAVWTAINASSATPSFPMPQGRLTPTSGTPVITSDATSATAIYYEPYVGNLIPIYSGSSMVATEFSALTLTLASQHALSTIYDVFVFSNSGVLTLVTGPAWNNSGAGAGARGTGASTTELTRVKGLWVNAVQMTARNGATTYTVGANLATYVGSIYIDGTAGQVTCHVAYGQSRKWGVWNAYNRRKIKLLAGDATATWSYATDTLRAARNQATNCLDIFAGLPEESFELEYSAFASGNLASNKYFNPRVGIGYNSTSSASGKLGRAGTNTDSANAINILPSVTITAKYEAIPTIGYNRITALEGNVTSDDVTWNGTSSYMVLSGVWWG